jgi:hypothetical protein
MGKWMERGVARRRTNSEPYADDAASTTSRPAPVMSVGKNDQTTKPQPDVQVDRAGWQARNADLMTDAERRQGLDPGGFCAQHRRPLSYPEQRREACSWCVPVDPIREPEYWASQWRRFSEL